MNHVGDDFLAGAALPGDEDVGLRRRHRIDQIVDLVHRLAREYRRESRLHELEALLELFRLLAKLVALADERFFF